MQARLAKTGNRYRARAAAARCRLILPLRGKEFECEEAGHSDRHQSSKANYFPIIHLRKSARRPKNPRDEMLRSAARELSGVKNIASLATPQIPCLVKARSALEISVRCPSSHGHITAEPAAPIGPPRRGRCHLRAMTIAGMLKKPCKRHEIRPKENAYER